MWPKVGVAATIVLAILMLVALVNLFAPVAWPPAGVAIVAYSDFIGQMRRGTIQAVEMRGDAIVATTDSGERFATQVPRPVALADRLTAAGARVFARPAEAERNPMLAYLLGWAPFLAIAIAFWWRLGRVGRRTPEPARAVQDGLVR